MNAKDFINKEYFEGDFYKNNGEIDINIICDFAEFYASKHITLQDKYDIITAFANKWNDTDESLISNDFIVKYLTNNI